MSKQKEPLNELHVNLLGKIFFTTLAAWLIGKTVNTKFRGSQEQINALANAAIASKKFQDELNRPGASVESVMVKLNVKNMSVVEFERQFNVKWPL